MLKRISLSLCVAALAVSLAAVPALAAASDPVAVVIKVRIGKAKDTENIVVFLLPDKAPKSVENFLAYARDGYYKDTIFHRVVPGFVVQGGGMDKDGKPKATRPAVKNEAGNGLKNRRGTIAMARTNVVDSATSQFYFNLVDNPALDHKDETEKGYGYAVFGEVFQGMEVVEKIAGVALKGERPVDAVVITDVKSMGSMPAGGMGGMKGGAPAGMPGGMPGGMPPRK